MPDPRQPIDDRGYPCGAPVDSEIATICLAYAERPEDEHPRPEDEGDLSLFVRETYTLEVHPGPPGPPPPGPAAEAVLAGSPAEVALALCEAAAGEACDPPEQCLPIATIDRQKGELEVVPCPRRTVASSDALLELILGLVRRVQAGTPELGVRAASRR